MKPERLSECEEYLRIVVSGEPDPTNYVYFNLAQCFIEGFDPQKLRAMLVSVDDVVKSSGLFVLNEVGGLAEDFLPEIIQLSTHADPHIRRSAQKLKDLYLGDSDPAGKR